LTDKSLSPTVGERARVRGECTRPTLPAGLSLRREREARGREREEKDTMPTHTLIRAEGLPEPISHYSDAVRAGDTIYVSGQASVDADGNLVGAGDVVAQARQVLENMKTVLAAAGATLDDVVKVTVYLANRDDRPKVNEVRKEYFKANRPASTLIEISRFAIEGMLIEIEAVAVAREEERPARKSTARRQEFAGYMIDFKGCTESLEQLFGTRDLSPSEMIRKLWAYIKRKKLARS
jgi:2-iminobutanoate/2-iminopropanoate deaminase